MKIEENNLQDSLIENQTSFLQEKKTDKNQKQVSFLTLFRFAQTSDKIYMLVGSLASMGAGTSFPFFVIFFGDITMIFIPGNQNNAESQALTLFIKFLIIGIVSWLLSSLGLYCWSYTGARQSMKTKNVYYKSLIEQQVAWFDSNDVNKLTTEITGNITMIQTAISQKVSQFLSTFITVIFGFFYAFFKCWQLSLLLTGTLPLLLLAGTLMSKATIRSAEQNKVSYQQASGRAEQAFGGIRTVKSLVGQTFEEKIFQKALKKGKTNTTKYSLFAAASFGFVNLIFLSVYSLGFWFGKYLIIQYPFDYNASIIVSTFFCFIIGGQSIGTISPIIKNFTQATVAVKHLNNLLNRKKTLQLLKDGVIIKQIETIQIKNMSFGYKKIQNFDEQPQNMVSNNINIDFIPGKVNAIVGESGCGKSTIIQLLMRFYDPIKGSIVINGHDMTELNLDNFLKKVGIVSQEPVLFAMSIEDNLKLANSELTQSQIIEALKKANAWQFVQRMNQGLQSYVGTGGVQLSGGQKQRIAIARAICKKPQLLILDEATSALDRKNQKEIQQTLASLQKAQITTIVIAHRLSTIQQADRIFVLGKQGVKQCGVHDELMKMEGAYCELVKSQLAVKNKDQEQKQNLNLNQAQNQKFMQIRGTISEFGDQQSLIKLKNSQKEEEIQEKSSLKNQQQNSVFTKLLKECKPNYIWLFIGCISALANGAIWPFFNIAFSNIIALLAIASEKENQINLYCILFMLIAFVGGAATFSYQFNFSLVGIRLVYNLRLKLFNKLMRMPIPYYDKNQNTPGAISTKLTIDAYQINNMVTGVLAAIFLNLSTVGVSLALAFYYSWKLTLIVLVISPLLAIPSIINGSIIKKYTQITQKAQKFLGSLLSDTVCNIRTVKSLGNKDVFIGKFQQKLGQLHKIVVEKSIKTSILLGMALGTIMIVEGLTFYLGAILFKNNQITNPQDIYIAIFSIVFAAIGAGQNSQLMPDMTKAKKSGSNIYNIIEQQSEFSEDKGLRVIKAIEGEIQFKNVTFKYPERDQIILKNFSLKVEKGQKIGIVGSSGSGKSTLIQLLERFYQIQSGEITMDGISIYDYDLYDYRKQIGLVSQEPVLFQGTVKSNILYNKEENQNLQIQQSATIAHANQFIENWDQKYEKEVGQKGSQVSGGQKQRLALARCLVRKPKMFFMDQSTSALDTDSQRIVFENLRPVFKKKTLLSIAHRLSTVQDADRIIMMKDGYIIEDGSYKQLMEMKEFFYKLSQGN